MLLGRRDDAQSQRGDVRQLGQASLADQVAGIVDKHIAAALLPLLAGVQEHIVLVAGQRTVGLKRPNVGALSVDVEEGFDVSGCVEVIVELEVDFGAKLECLAVPWSDSDGSVHLKEGSSE
jgi:hypothetical protein